MKPLFITNLKSFLVNKPALYVYESLDETEQYFIKSYLMIRFNVMSTEIQVMKKSETQFRFLANKLEFPLCAIDYIEQTYIDETKINCEETGILKLSFDEIIKLNNYFYDRVKEIIRTKNLY